MRQVNQFRKHAADGWNVGPLQVLITGRSAYVAEVSLSMRYDIVATLAGSILLVSAIFFAGFRRWLPLFGMGFALLLSCLVALASGLLIFGRLNMVTVGFCAILVGLGVALLSVHVDSRTGGVLRAIWLLPRISPSVVYALMWTWAAADDSEPGAGKDAALERAESGRRPPRQMP